MTDMLKLNREDMEQLATDIELNISQIEVVLASKRAKWDRYIQLFKAIRDREIKDFPWEGCSNIFIPELYNQAKTISSFLLMNTIRQDPPFKVEPYFKSNDEKKMAAAWEQFLSFYTVNVMEHISYWRKHIPYYVILGTHVAKLSFKAEGKLGWPQVCVTNVPLHRFLAYPGITDWHNAPFIGDVSWVSPSQMFRWVDEGLIKEEKAKNILEQVGQHHARDDIFPGPRLEPQAIPPNYVAICDIYMHWNRGELGNRPQKIRVIYERQTSEVLWVENWDKKRIPYELVYFQRDEDDLFGLGLGNYIETLQSAINTSANQTIDNATLANTRMIVSPPGSGLKPGDKIYPGRVIVSSMPDQIRPWAMGDIHQSSMAMMELMRQTMQQTSGASDSMQGMPDTVAKTRHTLGGQMLNLQYGAGKLDLSSAEIEEGLSNIIWHTLFLLTEYASGREFEFPTKPKSRTDMVSDILQGQDLAGIDELLQARLDPEEVDMLTFQLTSTPEEILRKERFKITPSHRFSNKETERQAALMLSQLVTQYLTKMIELGMMITQFQGQPGSELMIATVMKAWDSANRAMKRVLLSFSVEEAGDILIELQEVMNGFGPGMGNPEIAGGGTVEDEGGMAFDQAGTGAMGNASAIFGAFGGQ